MSLPIYQRVAVTDTGDVIPGAEYTVINENTGVAQPIYSDRTGATLLTPPYFADSAGTIQFFIAQGTTFRVAASGGVGTYTDRYVYGVAEAVLVQADGNVEILSGNVGIGIVPYTNSLSRSLDFVGGGQLFAYGDGFYSLSNLTYDGTWKLKNTGSGSATLLDGTFRVYTTPSGNAGEATSLLERMRIDSSGNVGIGTTTPGNYSAVGANNLVVGTNSGSNGVTLVGAADGYASLAFADGAGTGGASDYSGLIQYSHIANSMNFFTSSSERMRIDSVGNLLVGITSSPGNKFRVLSDTNNIAYLSNTAGTGVYLQSGATSWTGVSDERVKDIIEPITGAMSKFATLRTVIGKYKTDAENIRRPFLIAQDVQAVFPEVVDTQDDEAGTLGLQYEGLIPSMIAAMKEQQALIEALTARITTLEAK
jgi:hypothetical protein